MKKALTTFAEWLKAYGKQRAMIDFAITERTYYFWLSGKVKPNRDNMDKIMAAAPHLTADSILGYGHGGRA